ncbi:MAG TPA: methionyl-tRNA formyltransferase [Burkholderiales bacterium]|nr:methionyl-tRNA formyltransferase [Burkholderiales bacterium]
MRIAFAGTPAFAARALQALVDAKFDVALVMTQPDRPAGRGLKDTPSAVKQAAMKNGISCAQPATLKTDEALVGLRQMRAQALVVAAYGLILPPAVLEIFPMGCINIHASLLPRWRGAAPIQRAILAGDGETGISIMRMEQGLDTGPVYLTRAVPILADDSAGSLHDKLAALGAACIVEALPRIESGSLAAIAQAEAGVTYAHKVAKPEAAIDWTRDAVEVDRQVRAFNPFPGAYGVLDGETVKIWRGEAGDDAGATPGTILDCTSERLRIACGRGSFDVTELQKAGSRRLPVAEFLRGSVSLAGSRFTS